MARPIRRRYKASHFGYHSPSAQFTAVQFHSDAELRIASGAIPFDTSAGQCRRCRRRRRAEIGSHRRPPVRLDTHTQAAAQRAVDWLREHNLAEAVEYLPLRLLEDDPSLFLWGGLAEENLDIAERHIGLPVRYHGLEVRAERAAPTDPPRHLVRHWHLDLEDRRMLKIIVYLSDVDESTGPFEFLPLAASDQTRQTLRVRPGLTFLPDADVTAAVPSSLWQRVTGPAGTAVYADTARLLHRVKAPPTGVTDIRPPSSTPVIGPVTRWPGSCHPRISSSPCWRI